MVSWQSKKQSPVALKTTEAENMAACAATHDSIWLLHILKEF